jgi:hypothetical protein
MAQVTQVTLVDDIDGSEADTTVSFGVDGKSYEIDLNEKHAHELREILAPFVAAARRAGRASSSSGRSTRSSTTAGDRERNAEIRAWANANGFEVSERGRLSSTVLKAYEERNSAPPPAEEEKPKRRSRKKADA